MNLIYFFGSIFFLTDYFFSNEKLFGNEKRFFEIFMTLRIIKLLTLMKYLRKLEKMLKKCLHLYLNFLILIVFDIFSFALLGMQIFGLKYNEVIYDSQIYNYNNIFDSFLITFDVLTLDSWYKILITSFKYNKKYWTILFYLSLIFIGNFILLNLLTSIIIETFLKGKTNNNYEEKYIKYLKKIHGIKDIKKAQDILKNSSLESIKKKKKIKYLQYVFYLKIMRIFKNLI